MDNAIIREATDVLKKLSPQNQSYFMTLLRLAETAEEGARDEMLKQSRGRQKSDCRIFIRPE